MKIKKSILFIIKNMEEIIAGAALSCMVVIAFVNVVRRYFFNAPIPWGDEICLMLAAWAVFLGMSAAYKKNQHLGMEFLLDKCSPKGRFVMQQIQTAVVCGLSIFFTAVSIQFMEQTNKRTAILRISYKAVYLSAVIGFLMMSVYSVFYLYQSFFRKDGFRNHFVQTEEASEIRETDKGGGI